MEDLVFHFNGISSRVLFHDTFFLPEENCLCVFDENTSRLFGGSVLRRIEIAGGEVNKNWSSVDRIVDGALEESLARDGTLAAVGGGIVCDVTAFAASIYMRGCDLILVPTTLLALVDASLGGKTGVNLRGYKNMLGTFYPAREIHVSTAVLESLPNREYLGGMAEVIKTALLGDSELFETLDRERDSILARDSSLMSEVISRCLRVKGRVVEEDPEERGNRAFLNLGHTFAHALEAMQAFSGRTHGEAVAWGIARAMDLGIRAEVTDRGYASAVNDLLRLYGFRTSLDEGEREAITREAQKRGIAVDGDDYREALLNGMGKDKKRRSGTLRFVLQRDLCRTESMVMDKELVRHSLC